MEFQNNTIARILPSFSDIEFLVHMYCAEDPKFVQRLSVHFDEISNWASAISKNNHEREFIRNETALTLINLCMPMATQEERLVTLTEALLFN